MRAPANAAVLLWQVSHGALVAICVGGLPSAALPLWQPVQPPLLPAWVNRPVAVGAPALEPAFVGAGGGAGDAAELGPGVAATFAPAKLTVLWWQVPHGAVVGT